MKKNSILSTLTLFLLFITNNASAQQTAQSAPIKIGVISLQELIVVMPETKKADSVLQNFQKELQGTYVEMIKEYQSKDSSFRVDSAKLSNTTKELKKGDLARLAQQIQSFQQSVEENMQKKQQELLNPIRIQASEAIQKYAQKNGYTHVIEKGAFYHMQAGDDILAAIKKELKIKEDPKNK